NVTVTLTERGAELVRVALATYRARCEELVGALPEPTRAALAEHIPAWLDFFEPDERTAPRLGVVVAPSAVAARMRRAVGLEPLAGVLVLRVGRGTPAAEAGLAQGDLIVEADHQPVHSTGDLDRAVRSADGALRLGAVRGTDARDVTVT